MLIGLGATVYGLLFDKGIAWAGALIVLGTIVSFFFDFHVLNVLLESRAMRRAERRRKARCATCSEETLSAPPTRSRTVP